VPTCKMKLVPLSDFSPNSVTRAWVSIPHPTLPLLATPSSDRNVLIYSLQNFRLHSKLEKGHKRSIRTVAWKPNLSPDTLSIVTGSFDATAGIWRRNEAAAKMEALGLETDVTNVEGDEEEEPHDWEFSLVLEGHDSEIKGVAFSQSGQYLATCSRDKSVWIWEEIGAEGEDEWETVAVLQEHEGDVKAVSWCPDDANGELLASASYDDTVRLWREDSEGEWGCVAVLTGHEGTVWGLDWEPSARTAGGDTEEDITEGTKPLRLITCSADATIRVWRKVLPSDPGRQVRSNGIPSTIRRTSSGEDWVCESVLPKVHDRHILSVSWSKKTGRVVSTGGDSQVVVYEERLRTSQTKSGVEPAADNTDILDGDHEQEDSNSHPSEQELATEWHVLTILPLAHGPYEINHAVWCGRFDGGHKGEEEMIVTTGDDGLVKAWEIKE
jgi:cytosolic iron-sulfur protein assembly protein CIAO1